MKLLLNLRCRNWVRQILNGLWPQKLTMAREDETVCEHLWRWHMEYTGNPRISSKYWHEQLAVLKYLALSKSGRVPEKLAREALAYLL